MDTKHRQMLSLLKLRPHLTVKPFSPLQVHLLGEGVSCEWDFTSAGKSNQKENIRSVLFWRCCSEHSEEMNVRESRKQLKKKKKGRN